jgi:hypothetical protein
MFTVDFVKFLAQFGQADAQSRIPNGMHQPSRLVISVLGLCGDVLTQPPIPRLHFRKLISPSQTAIDLVVNKRYQLLVSLSA